MTKQQEKLLENFIRNEVRRSLNESTQTKETVKRKIKILTSHLKDFNDEISLGKYEDRYDEIYNALNSLQRLIETFE